MYSAVIPVKKSSSRLPGKNLLPFARSNLLRDKIHQLKKVPEIKEILVSSDSAEMLQIARDEGCRVDERPSHFADESRPFPEFVKYVTELLDFKNMVWACVTSPMFGSRHLSEAIKTYEDLPPAQYDSLVAVTPFQHYLFDDRGPINFGPGGEHLNSQDLPRLKLFTNGVNIAPVSRAREWGYQFGFRPYQFEVNQEFSIDIDTHVDYLIAQTLFEKFGHLR
jgi:N-acylneuraminate cytidylyltransferase